MSSDDHHEDGSIDSGFSESQDISDKSSLSTFNSDTGESLSGSRTTLNCDENETGVKEQNPETEVAESSQVEVQQPIENSTTPKDSDESTEEEEEEPIDSNHHFLRHDRAERSGPKVPTTSLRQVLDTRGASPKAPIKLMTTKPKDLRNTKCPSKLMDAASTFASTESCAKRAENATCVRTQNERSANAYASEKKISQSPYYSSPKAGGINLCKKIRVFNRNGVEVDIKSVKVNYATKTISVKTKTGATLTYDPKILSVEELHIIEDAVSKTARAGLWLSCQFKLVVEGVLNQTGHEKFIQTMLNADMLQFAMVNGFHVRSRSKYVSPVATYQNPLDVLNALLKAVVESERNSMSEEEPLSKFSKLIPWTEFVMNSDVKAVLKSSKTIEIQGNVLDISLRLIAIDWLGKIYYEDSDNCLVAQKPFLNDFKVHYAQYIKAHEELARVEQYAIVVGLLLNKKYTGPRIDSFKCPPIKCTIDQTGTPELDAFYIKAELQERLIQREPNRQNQLAMAITLAYDWTNQRQDLKAIDASLFALRLLKEFIADNSVQLPVIKANMAKCVHILARSVLGKGGKMPNLTNQQRSEIGELFGQSMGSGNNDATTQIQILKNVIEIGMSVSVEIGDWNLAAQFCSIIGELLMKNNPKLIPLIFVNPKFFLEQFSKFIKTISTMKFPEVSPNCTIKPSEITKPFVEANTGCSCITLVEKILNCLNPSNVYLDESKQCIMQLMGFAFYTTSLDRQMFKPELYADQVHCLGLTMAAFSIFFGSCSRNLAPASEPNVDWTIPCAFALYSMLIILERLRNLSQQIDSLNEWQMISDVSLRYMNDPTTANMQAALLRFGETESKSENPIERFFLKSLIGAIYKQAGSIETGKRWAREAFTEVASNLLMTPFGPIPVSTEIQFPSK